MRNVVRTLEVVDWDDSGSLQHNDSPTPATQNAPLRRPGSVISNAVSLSLRSPALACLWNNDVFHPPHYLECTGDMPSSCVYRDKTEVRQNRSTSELSNCSQLNGRRRGTDGRRGATGDRRDVFWYLGTAALRSGLFDIFPGFQFPIPVCPTLGCSTPYQPVRMIPRR